MIALSAASNIISEGQLTFHFSLDISPKRAGREGCLCSCDIPCRCPNVQPSTRITILEYDTELAKESVVIFLCAILHGQREGALLVRAAHDEVGHQGWLAIGICDLLNSQPEH